MGVWWGHLDRERQRRVVDVAREELDDARELREAQLGAHVVDEVGERRVRERPQRLVREPPDADEHLLVEQHVDLREEAAAEVGREDVARRDEQLLARRDRVARARGEQLDHGLGDGVLERLHQLGKPAQQVREERERLDLARDELLVPRALQLVRDLGARLGGGPVGWPGWMLALLRVGASRAVRRARSSNNA